MITLEEACEIYMQHERFPIDVINETEDSWAFSPDAGGELIGVMIPVVNKETGRLTHEYMFDYIDEPEVDIPEEYKQ